VHGDEGEAVALSAFPHLLSDLVDRADQQERGVQHLLRREIRQSAPGPLARPGRLLHAKIRRPPRPVPRPAHAAWADNVGVW